MADKRIKIWHLWRDWELSLDWHQWMFGFNYFPAKTLFPGPTFNLFLGPLRLGWWEGAELFWDTKEQEVMES